MPRSQFPSAIFDNNALLLKVFRHLDVEDLARSMRVCGKWNMLLTSSPRMWTEIVLHVSAFAESRQVARLESCLNRSKLKLSVTITFPRVLGSMPPSLRYLVQNASRFHSLSLVDVTNAQIKMISGENLTLFWLKSLSIDSREPIELTLPACPNLTTVNIRGEAILSDTTPLWEEVRSLELLSYGYDDLNSLAILNHCPSVETFELGCSCPETIDTSCVTRSTSVTHLHLQIRCTEDCSPYLQGLELPNLTSLKMTSMNDWIKFPVTKEDILDFTSRSGCKLRELHLYGPRIDKEDFLEILRATPTLRRVSLFFPSAAHPHRALTNDFMREMKREDPVLLPLLTSLRFYVNKTFDSSLLAEMLEKRQEIQEVVVPDWIKFRKSPWRKLVKDGRRVRSVSAEWFADM